MRPIVPARLRRALHARPFVSDLVVLPSVPSTNDALRALAAGGAAEGTVVIAEEQTSGRGRRGRSWHSAPGLGLYVSVLFRAVGPASELTRWTLGGALAACQSCHDLGLSDVTIKWPNDLMWRGKKLAGILAETRSQGGGPAELVLGTGFNVHHATDDFPRELRELATSMRLIRDGREADREELALAYLHRLGAVADALRRRDWSSIARRWEKLTEGVRGRRVRVVAASDASGDGASTAPIEGMTEGIDDVGALLVRRDDGQLVTVRSAGSVAPLTLA